jgi:hypothetical protein
MLRALRARVVRMARGVLERLRELGRRLGDAIDESLRPGPDLRRVPVPVPVEVEPRLRRRGPSSEGGR